MERMKPSRPLLICALVFVLSCGGNESKSPPSPPSAPSPVPPGPAVPTRYTVSGTVRDAPGGPIEGVDVAGGALFSKTGPGFSTKTDVAGRYRGELPAGTWQFSFRKPGYQTFESGNVSVSGDTILDATLHLGIQVFGTVKEVGVGPLDDARVEVVSGPDMGRSTLTGHPIPGQYFFDHLLPGEFRLRASKEGYDPVEQILKATADTFNVDFTLKWSYGSCLKSVAPVFFDRYPSAGGSETASVEINGDHRWSATADVPWIEVIQRFPQTGSGRVTFRVLPNPVGAVDRRKGAVMIRCSASEGQNVWIWQLPDCQVQLRAAPDSPATFPANGGIGHLLMHTGVAGCRWEARSEAEWIRTSGVSSWSGDLDVGVFFVVNPNTTGHARMGLFIVGETAWQVTQQ